MTSYALAVCPLDDYSPVTLFQKTLHNIMAFYETYLALWKIAPFRCVENVRNLIFQYCECLPLTPMPKSFHNVIASAGTCFAPCKMVLSRHVVILRNFVIM